MKLGKFSIELLETGRFGLDGGAMFGVVPKNLWSKAYHKPDEENRIPMAAKVLLVQFENRKILVDTGNGNKMSDKLQKIYGIDNSRYTLASSLERFSLRCEDITDVILTHLHFDHAGGATDFDNGKLCPAFPNAKYYVQREQLEWALNPTEKDRASFMKENFECLIADGLLEAIDGEGEIHAGISVVPLYGHTKAMQMVKIHDGLKTLAFCADLFPTSAHIPVPYVMGYDNFPLTTIEEKKKYLPQAVEEKWTIVFEHDAFTQAGIVHAGEKGFLVGETIEITKYGA